jgi:Trypsin-co-occurring domain 1
MRDLPKYGLAKYVRRKAWPVGVGIASQLVQVMLPSGDAVWVRIESPSHGGEESLRDVALSDKALTNIGAGVVPGFRETIRGVVESVRGSLDDLCPDDLTVEFGIEISAGTGRVLSVLAEGSGRAHVTVSATWQRGHDEQREATT